jgi:hypothetical protein
MPIPIRTPKTRSIHRGRCGPHDVSICTGMNLWGNIKFQENIDHHANFRTFPVAMLTLFR